MLLLATPAATFQEESVNVSTVFGSTLNVVFGGVAHDLEVEIDLIDSNDVLTSVVLLHTSEERLSEEETGDPEGLRCAVVNPILEELKPLDEVKHPRSEWLQRRVSFLGPETRYLVIEETVADSLKFKRHDDLTLDGLANVDQ